MIIGSDFDGVIADDTQARIDYIKEKYKIDVTPAQIHGSALERIGRDVKKDVEISVNCSERTMQFTPIPGVKEVFSKLVKEGSKIIIITGRTKEGIKWAKKFMETHKIPFHHIVSAKEFFVNPKRELQRIEDGFIPDLKGKGKWAHHLEPAVFVEDSDKHVMHLLPLQDKIKIFFYDHPYNKNFSAPGVKRVYSWFEVYDEIESLKVVFSK